MAYAGGIYHPHSNHHLQNGEEIGFEEISTCWVPSRYLCMQAAMEKIYVTMLFNHKSANITYSEMTEVCTTMS